MQWDKNSLRKNGMITAAAKRLTHPEHTQKYIPMLHEIIDSVFKIAANNNNKKIIIMANRMRSFVASLFVDTIKKKDISSFFTEQIMVIYDPQRTNKIFLDVFVSNLSLNNINFDTYYS